MPASASRGALALRGALAALAVLVVGVVELCALTLSILQREEWWCDDCPDQPDAVYASNERYLEAVLGLTVGALVVALVAVGIAVAVRSARPLRIGIPIAVVLLVVAAGATALHWFRF